MDKDQFLARLGLTAEEFIDLEHRFRDLQRLINKAQAEAIRIAMRTPEEIFGNEISEPQLNGIVSELTFDVFRQDVNDGASTSKYVSFPPGTGNTSNSTAKPPKKTHRKGHAS